MERKQLLLFVVSNFYINNEIQIVLRQLLKTFLTMIEKIVKCVIYCCFSNNHLQDKQTLLKI